MSRTVLIYRMGSLGDTIVALPCFHRIMASYPDHRRVVLTNFPMSSKAAPIESILTNGGFAHDYVAYPYGTRSPRRLFSIIRKLRALRAETMIYVGGGRGVGIVRRDLAFFRLAGFRHVIGAPRSVDLDSGRIDTATGHTEHEASRLARCLGELGPIDTGDPASWDLRLTADEVARAHAVLGDLADRPFIAVNTGGKLAVQDWDEPNWQQLIARLDRSISVPLVFIGAKEDSRRADMLGGLWGHRILDACGKLSPRETGALLRRATLFIGHDSGPLHLAAASGVPCVAMFGNNNPPGKWFPFGNGHRVHHDPVDVRRIPPASVEASVLDLLRQAAPATSASTTVG